MPDSIRASGKKICYKVFYQLCKKMIYQGYTSPSQINNDLIINQFLLYYLVVNYYLWSFIHRSDCFLIHLDSVQVFH
ncbi:hypothetical protein QE390_003763 [Siphonobacter sp. SORGH_AS 1065]|nr:hypothetical protein [Siphonobacter sp. SORGH_AS_1065]